MLRAAFLKDNVWVTHYDRHERFPAGDYPNQHPGGAGLPEYQRADRPIVDADIVFLVLVRDAPRRPPGRLAGPCGRKDRLHTQAIRLLQPPQPGTRCLRGPSHS